MEEIRRPDWQSAREISNSANLFKGKLKEIRGKNWGQSKIGVNPGISLIFVSESFGNIGVIHDK